MGRWRPPAEHSTALITRDGFERMKAELDDLWRVRRPEIVRALSAAAAEGDRSENAEYIYRKKQLGELDRRVRYLSKRVPALKVIESAPADRDAIFFGATVELEDTATGESLCYRIVGPDEAEPSKGDISIDSPVARALLKKRVDDEVEVQLPIGPRRVAVVDVRYPG
ncbi:transcription elongation factor GreB [Lysobacter sp. TY2-98]|uniref:transcription elongation factor GreB n=1 Tax=Lysobacter sp. TY2-98 TaxID=2290922 RepID=UPI000E2008CC|nr:transcription elongation factor GreB [Lysobacter sp. TY2-98]AXK71936.1 transcription elongation factor GreB [Lysobacter sp. TY2-98]